jgi:hypothetical protein
VFDPMARAEPDDADHQAVPEPPDTGDEVVGFAIGGLSALGSAALEDHPAIYEAVHRTLQDRLADVEG